MRIIVVKPIITSSGATRYDKITNNAEWRWFMIKIKFTQNPSDGAVNSRNCHSSKMKLITIHVLFFFFVFFLLQNVSDLTSFILKNTFEIPLNCYRFVKVLSSYSLSKLSNTFPNFQSLPYIKQYWLIFI